MEFPQDQLILFKAFTSAGVVAARYGLFDLGWGAVDEVTVSQILKKGISSFTYFYDVTNKKSVNITFEGAIEELTVKEPVLVDIKGPNPIDFENGYIAFEDLPDDQRHLPSESDKNHKKNLESLLNALSKDSSDEDDEDADDLDLDEDEEDEEDDDSMDLTGAIEVFDGSEDLTL